jgi:hypothetical protein
LSGSTPKFHEYEKLSFSELIATLEGIERLRSCVEQRVDTLMRLCDTHSDFIHRLINMQMLEFFQDDDPIPHDLRLKLRLLIAERAVPKQLEVMYIGIVSQGRVRSLEDLTELQGYLLWAILGGEHAVA